MNQETVLSTGQAVLRLMQWIEKFPEHAQMHSEHVYRMSKLAIKMGFGAMILFCHAVFPFLFSSAKEEVMESICKEYTEVLKPAVEKEKEREKEKEKAL